MPKTGPTHLRGTGSTVKQWLNPAIEATARAVFRVDQYADMFERAAMASTGRAALRGLCRRRLAPDVAGSPLLFIHVPKNGGTSIKRALYRSDPGHVTIRYYDLFFPAHLARAETLAMLRDPTERFLSAFDFLMKGGGGDVAIQPVPMRRMAHIRDVDQFLDFLEGARGDWLKVDTFARPQSWYVADRHGVIRVRHLWVLGEAGAALDDFLAARGVGPVGHANRTERQTRTLTDVQRARVERLYAEDMRLFAAVKAAGGYCDRLAGCPLGQL